MSGLISECQCFLHSQEFKGYVFKIMGGQDKEGFPMKQGVLTNGRVRLLMHRCASEKHAQGALRRASFRCASDSALTSCFARFFATQRCAVLPWLRAPQRRAPQEVRARVHCLPGPRDDEPRHREAG